MGTTSTPNLTLIKPNPFEEEDTWGALLNGNWDKVDALGTVSAKAIAAVTPAADRLAYFTSGTAAAVTPFTAFARTLIDDADAATMRSTLGLGSVSTLSSVNLTTNVTDILPVANGGTGGNTAAAARTALSVPAISDLAAYAPLASPSLTGTPAAPTAAVDTNTTQLATTAYVIGQGYLKSSTASTTYLTSATASSTYLTSATASSTYLPSATAASTYATIATVSGIASATTANVLNATAGATAGGVGTYGFMLWNSLGANQNEGTTVAGSSLTFTMMNGATGGNAATGTWRLMGRVTVANAASLFLRIS